MEAKAESLTTPSEHKRKFHEWRKKHYDEFYAVKRARERKKVSETHFHIVIACLVAIILLGSETARPRGRGRG